MTERRNEVKQLGRGDSAVLPVDLFGQEDEFVAVGFTLGDLVSGEPLFRHAILPDGWKYDGLVHSRRKIVDEFGRERVRVFYDPSPHACLVLRYSVDRVPGKDCVRDSVTNTIVFTATAADGYPECWAWISENEGKW